MISDSNKFSLTLRNIAPREGTETLDKSATLILGKALRNIAPREGTETGKGKKEHTSPVD